MNNEFNFKKLNMPYIIIDFDDMQNNGKHIVSGEYVNPKNPDKNFTFKNAIAYLNLQRNEQNND